MTTSSPEMDLDLQTSDKILGDNKKSDLISPVSTDTGFASDEAHDSPVSETGKDLEESEPLSKEDEPQEKKDGDSEKLPEGDGYMDILGNGMLRKKVLVPGNGIDSRPTNGGTVKLNISGRLDDGTQVEDGEISFILNDGDVIMALDLGVALMEMGEKCELITSPRYAYGEQGRDPDIPKAATITFTLELIDFKPPVPVSSLTVQERLQQGENKRLRGNFLFGRGDFSGAINSYTKAVNVLDETDLNAGLEDSDRAQLEDSWTKCYNNMAACQLKIDATDAAIRSAEKVLASQPNNVKAIYRKGKAYRAKGDLDVAISCLKTAVKLDPESRMLHQELFALTKKKNKETETERNLYRKMLGVDTGKTASKTTKEEKSSNRMLTWGVAIGGTVAAILAAGYAWIKRSGV